MIRHIIKFDRGLDENSAEEVHNLISRTFIAANKKNYSEGTLESLVYTQETQDMFLQYYKQVLKNESPKISVLAYDDEKLIGTGFLSGGYRPYMGADKIDGHTLLYGMYVDPDYQRYKKGVKIGTTIFDLILYNARLKGIKAIHALATDFQGVLHFYNQLGFQKKGDVTMTYENLALKMHDIELEI